ncbi:zinc finger protein 436-like [Cataglyphis hispanica]|uniref:zinc finger protein 436-like n=1 Tax=Cataglyphis hispanica TaxID=1086592 RepID=UPI00217F415D|nr:zinc finger protein 436-like [Cataglyphis hispanica]
MSSNISSCIENKCRACMKEGGKMLPMYDDKTTSKVNLSYKLAELTSIQIDKFDGLPNMLCSKCAYRTYVLYNFRLKVQESDKKFRMILENQMVSAKKDELDNDRDNEDSIVQTDESLELNISTDTSIHNAEFLENLKIDETIKSEQNESHIPQLLENDNKENNNLQLNELFYNILQEINENQSMDAHIVKTDIPEEISKILASQDITIMYVPHDSVNESMSESIFVENTLTSDQKQEEIENDNNTFAFAMEILNEKKDEISSNVHNSSPMETNMTRKNKRICSERVDDETQSKNKQLKSNSNIEKAARTEDSDESDSDYFIDAKDNILGSVNDAIVRIKEVKQENGIEYQCTLCQQNYEELSSMLLHTVDNHVSSNGPFFCMVCEKDCESHRELRAHVKTHTGREPYSCFICKKGYSKKRYLKRHMMCHSDFPRHRCSKCGCRFKAKSELESHMKTHSVPYSCDQCPRVFNHKGNYKRHLVSHLDPQGLYLPKYPCRYCGKRFPNNRTLETHIRVHTGERPFKCQYCDKSFSQRGNLINHTRIHSNPRSYTCEVCGKKFNQRATLRDHGLLHTGEKPHVCNVCGKAFTVSAALRRHMFNHAENKPFKCETCNMGFVGKYDLRRHMRVHEDRPKEKRRRNTMSKSSDLVQQELEESLAIIEEPSTETVLIEQVFLPQNVTQIVVNHVESEKENEDALFNLHCYNSALIQYS